MATAIEALLRHRAAQQGQEPDLVESELLAGVLSWEVQDSEAAIQGIQQGLDDFEAGRSRSFQDFAEEQRSKYNLLTT